MIPVGVVSGYLGSGKTTRLGRLLMNPGFENTAVIVNEFGVIGIDHDLLETGADQTFVLPNGCVCCSARSGLETVLWDIWKRNSLGAIAVERVIVETSGLADPMAVFQTIAPGGPLAGRFSRRNLVVMVDAGTGVKALRSSCESQRQVAFADLIKITKLDSAPLPPELLPLLRALNPGVEIDQTTAAALCADDLFVARSGAAIARELGVQTLQPASDTRHHQELQAVALIEARPLPASLLALFLEGLAANAADRVLRIKGIVHIAGSSDCPVVVQGTGDRRAELTRLSKWPSEDRRTRISIIGRGLPPRWPELLFRVLQAELDELHAACEPGGRCSDPRWR